MARNLRVKPKKAPQTTRESLLGEHTPASGLWVIGDAVVSGERLLALSGPPLNIEKPAAVDETVEIGRAHV